MIVGLAEANQDHGGKAATLGRLLRSGFRVPDGFVIPDSTDDGWVGDLPAALESVGPGPFAVRSSAVGEDGAIASFAGQLGTLLGVSGRDVVDAVRACRQSADTEAVRTYSARLRQDLDTPSVIVQRLVEPEAAGVLFTRHPTTGAELIVIEAFPGRGDVVAAESVSPQTWTLDVDRILETPRIPNPVDGDRGPVLSDVQVVELAATARQVESTLGGPQDIEWATADGTIWILQARPITGLDRVVADIDIALPTPDRVGRLELLGTPVSPGRAIGPARIVTGLDDFAEFGEGEILVCRATSPAWTPVLAMAAAVVSETGGMLSHAAIVAREFRIPAVVGVPDAMTALRPSVELIVDGTNGTVRTTGG